MIVDVRIVEGEVARAAAGPAGSGVGAVVTFEGIVRGQEDGRAIAALEYEVYRGMAESELRRLASEIAVGHQLAAVRVWHSSGRVAVGRCSFRLEMEAAHRAEALRAMAEFIERMKRDVPIWKRALL